MKVLFSLLLFVVLGGVYGDCITCDQSFECSGTTINTVSNVNCYGYYGCENSTVNSSSALMYGAYSGYYADISSDNVYAYGLYSLLNSKVKSTSVTAYGFAGAAYAQIEALTDTLDIKLYGYYSGFYTDILCYSGATCNVECGEERGCLNLNFYCFSGSICHYNCDDDPDNCPILYSGVAPAVSDSSDSSNSRLLLAHNNIINRHYNTNNNNKRQSNNDIKQLNKQSKFDLTDNEITAHLRRNREKKAIKSKTLNKRNKNDNNGNNDQISNNLMPVLNNNIESNNNNSIWQFIHNSGYATYIYFIGGIIFGQILLGLTLCFCFDFKCSKMFHDKNVEYQSLI